MGWMRGYGNSNSFWPFNLEGKPNRSAIQVFAWRRGWLALGDAKYFEHSIGTWSLLSKVSRWLLQHHWSSGRGLKLQGVAKCRTFDFPFVAKTGLCRQFRQSFAARLPAGAESFSHFIAFSLIHFCPWMWCMSRMSYVMYLQDLQSEVTLVTQHVWLALGIPTKRCLHNCLALHQTSSIDE